MKTGIFKAAKKRLEAFGYAFKDSDAAVLGFSCDKTENHIKNDCNISEIPEGLFAVAVDMSVGEFLRSKKTFAPDDLAGLDLSAAVKQIQVGDTSTTFGDGSLTAEQRLDALINRLTTYGLGELSCYRRIRW